MKAQILICCLILLKEASSFAVNSEKAEEQYIQESRAGSEVADENGKFFKNPFFPLFIITVRPTTCTGLKDGEGGICKTKRQCEQDGGKVDGNCAGRFGVCCVVENRCGAVVKTNNSVLINDDFPESLQEAGNCQYVIEKISPNICQMRIDFESLVLQGPNEETSLCEDDTFTVVGTSGENPSVICGTNTGQHMYIDLASGAGSARINIATRSSGTPRSWRIKVAQIECDSVYRAPQNCLQYFTDYSGIINSFNYQDSDGGHHIGGLSYTVCMQAREGYCGISYQSEGFSVTGNGTTGAEEEAIAGDDDCNTDFISLFVQNKMGEVEPDRYCGNSFNDTTTFSKPFEIRVITDLDEEDEEIDNRGFSLRYMQIPC